MYGFDYGDDDINTIPDLEAPQRYLWDGYGVGTYSDKYLHNASHILGTDSRGYSRLNSEVVFFAGHGDSALVKFPSGSLLYAAQLINMENVKIAVWAACYSSNQDNFDNSMIDNSVNAGAKASIGWPGSILSSSARKFTDRLFEELSQGTPLATAASYASDGIIWPWDNIHEFRIAGNAWTTITYTIPNKSSVNVIDSFLLDDYIVSTASGEWYRYDYKDGASRIYRMINGCLTNDFYDVQYDGDKIINITHSGIKFSEQTILPINSKSTAISSKQLDALTNTETHRIYYITEKEIIPIEINYCTYESKDGYIYAEAVCFNLNDNFRVDYAEISQIGAE